MTLLRTFAISAASLFFLTGADHRESPALAISTSSDAAKGGEIELLSWSWGETKEPRQGPGSIKIEARGGKHSDLLARWHREQKVLPMAKLETAEGDDTEYYTITMSDVLVSSYQSSGSAGGDSIPMDSFSLNFAKIEYGYKPQKKDTRNKKQ